MSQMPLYDINSTFSRYLSDLEEADAKTILPAIIRHTSVKILESCYDREGFRISRTLYHDVAAMTGTFVERNAQGDIILAIVPPTLSTEQSGLDQNFVTTFVDGVLKRIPSDKLPKDYSSSSNTIDYGCSSSDHNGTGHYLHRFNKENNERGGSVKNILLKTKQEGHSNVGIFASAFQSQYERTFMNEFDIDSLQEFPSIEHIWKAANLVALEAGIENGIDPPFDGCTFYSSASVGIGNTSKPHHDRKNTMISMGTACDAHASLTDTGHVLFIVHTPNGDGTWTAHAIPQEYLTVTYFRGNECCHMACDLYTWFHEIGMHSLSVLMRDYVKRKALGNQQKYEEHQILRVWISTYCKASMYDLAWELRNYTLAVEPLEVYRIVRNSNDGGIRAHRNRRTQKSDWKLRLVKMNYGSKSPYSKSYV